MMHIASSATSSSSTAVRVAPPALYRHGYVSGTEKFRRIWAPCFACALYRMYTDAGFAQDMHYTYVYPRYNDQSLIKKRLVGVRLRSGTLIEICTSRFLFTERQRLYEISTQNLIYVHRFVIPACMKPERLAQSELLSSSFLFTCWSVQLLRTPRVNSDQYQQQSQLATVQ